MFLDHDDDECTADVGLMGYMGCHRYPGCGCHQPDTSPPDTRTPDEFWLDSWDQELEGMLFSLELHSELPADLARAAPQHQVIVKRQTAQLTALIKQFRAQLAKR